MMTRNAATAGLVAFLATFLATTASIAVPFSLDWTIRISDTRNPSIFPAGSLIFMRTDGDDRTLASISILDHNRTLITIVETELLYLPGRFADSASMIIYDVPGPVFPAGARDDLEFWAINPFGPYQLYLTLRFDGPHGFSFPLDNSNPPDISRLTINRFGLFDRIPDFGQLAIVGEVVGVSSSVPEPSTAALIAIGLGLMSRKGRSTAEASRVCDRLRRSRR